MKSSYTKFNGKLIIRIVENQKINKFGYFITREFSSLGENRLEEMYNSTKRLFNDKKISLQIFNEIKRILEELKEKNECN